MRFLEMQDIPAPIPRHQSRVLRNDTLLYPCTLNTQLSMGIRKSNMSIHTRVSISIRTSNQIMYTQMSMGIRKSNQSIYSQLFMGILKYNQSM